MRLLTALRRIQNSRTHPRYARQLDDRRHPADGRNATIDGRERHPSDCSNPEPTCLNPPARNLPADPGNGNFWLHHEDPPTAFRSRLNHLSPTGKSSDPSAIQT
jgi:hypothetical protein